MTKSRFRQIYGVVILLTILITTGVLFFVAPPSDNKSVIDMALGALIGAFGSVVKDLYSDAKDHSEIDLKKALVNKLEHGKN